MNVRARLIWVFAVVASILFLAVLPTQAKGQSGTTRHHSPNTIDGRIYSTSNLPACQRSFNVFKVSRSFLKKCGVKTIPLVTVRPLPGGGKDYVYKDGTHMPVPPKGFNSCTATDKQLTEYNFPPREHTTGNAKCRPAIVEPQGPFIVATNMTSGAVSESGRGGGGNIGFSTGSTDASTSPAGSTSSTTSGSMGIPDTGGPSLLLYVAVLFMTAGIVTLLVLRRRIR